MCATINPLCMSLLPGRRGRETRPEYQGCIAASRPLYGSFQAEWRTLRINWSKGRTTATGRYRRVATNVSGSCKCCDVPGRMWVALTFVYLFSVHFLTACFHTDLLHCAFEKHTQSYKMNKSPKIGKWITRYSYVSYPLQGAKPKYLTKSIYRYRAAVVLYIIEMFETFILRENCNRNTTTESPKRSMRSLR